MMNTTLISLTTFGGLFGAGILAMRISKAMPEHHLTSETKDTVKLAMGLVATMTALVLGLLVASAKSTYDNANTSITTNAAKIVLLDRLLAHYGPEADPVRGMLKRSAERMTAVLWPSSNPHGVQLDPRAASGDDAYDALLKLAPQDDVQRALKSQALSIASDVGLARWLVFTQSSSSLSLTLLAVVICWLAILFFSFGLFAPPHPTATLALMVSAISVSGAIFLILELDQPLDGLIHISSNAMQIALSHLGK